MEDTVKVLRIIEYVGPRSDIERVLAKSLTGEHVFGNLQIRVRTIDRNLDFFEDFGSDL